MSNKIVFPPTPGDCAKITGATIFTEQGAIEMDTRLDDTVAEPIFPSTVDWFWEAIESSNETLYVSLHTSPPDIDTGEWKELGYPRVGINKPC